MANGGTIPPNYNPQAGTNQGYDMWNPVNFLNQVGERWGPGSDTSPSIWDYQRPPPAGYQYPERETMAGQWGTAMARRAEWVMNAENQRQWSDLEKDMDYWNNVLETAQSEEERQGATRGLEQTQIKMNDLRTRTETGAGNIRAFPAIAENPRLLGQWGEIAAQQEGAFGWQPPGVSAPGTPPPSPDVPTTPAAPTVDPYARIHGGQQQDVGTYAAAPGGQAPSGFMNALAGAERTAGQIFDYVGAPRLQQLFQGGVPEGAFAGDVAGQRIPYNPQTALRYQYGQMRPGEELGGGVVPPGETLTPEEEAARNRMASFAPVDTPYREGRMRGFGTFADLQRSALERGRGPGQFTRGEMQNIYEGQSGVRERFGSPAALTGYLQGETSGYSPYKGRDQRQTVDMGQGTQDYIVRRDAYGNVTSYTPA